jgi:hypothetical protein
MGYQSQVRCLIYGSKEDMDAFLTTETIVGGSRVLKDFENCLLRYVIKVPVIEEYPINSDAPKKDLHVLDMQEDSTKWYEDFPEVSGWMKFMNEAPEMGLQFEFIRVGENHGDIEEHCSDSPRGFIYVTSPVIEDDIDKADEIPVL